MIFSLQTGLDIDAIGPTGWDFSDHKNYIKKFYQFQSSAGRIGTNVNMGHVIFQINPDTNFVQPGKPRIGVRDLYDQGFSAAVYSGFCRADQDDRKCTAVTGQTNEVHEIDFIRKPTHYIPDGTYKITTNGFYPFCGCDTDGAQGANVPPSTSTSTSAQSSPAGSVNIPLPTLDTQ